MKASDYERIARILGGAITEIQPPVFGGFSAPRTAVERYRSIPDTYRRVHLPQEQMESIAKAFAKTNGGYEPDRVLVDPRLSSVFFATCHRMGVTADDSVIAKKLQDMRKNRASGIVIPKAKRDSGINSDPYSYIAEMAFKQLNFRREISVDDVITEQVTGKEFDLIVKKIDPSASPINVKWALLSLRKSRALGDARLAKIASLDASFLEDKFSHAGNLAAFQSSDVPKERGVYALHEVNDNDMYLFVGATSDLRASLAPFRNGRPFVHLSSGPHQPQASNIAADYLVVKRSFFGGSAIDWSVKLIQARSPKYNYHFERVAA